MNYARMCDMVIAMSQTPAPRRAERKRAEQAAEMRAEIVEAAFAEFAENGYHQTAIGNIATRLGVSAGTLYNYFTNKREILDHVVDGVVAQLAAGIAEAMASDIPANLDEYRAQMLRVSDAYDAILQTDPRVARLLVLEATSIDQQLSDRLLEIFDQSNQAIATYLDHGVERGFFRADLNTAGTADAVTGMMLTGAFRSLRSGLDHAAREAQREAIVGLLIDGIRT